jgi:putative peptide zinc metalloprotease protein
MHAGRWVGGSEIIARIVSPGAYDVQAFISEGDTQRIAQGALARFIPDDPTQKSRRAKLVERATSAALTLDQPILASTNGGPIAVDKEGTTLKPHKPVFRARLIAERGDPTDEALIQIVPGQVRIDAESRSILGTLTRWLMQILRGEASLS